MNITELDNFRLSDTVKFHDRLNHRLWDNSEHIRSDVKDKLLQIAADFQEFLGIPDLDVKDITVSGSNAAYNYTPNSDIDLHLVVDLPEADRSEVFRELFDAKKYQYNDMHNIKIGGYDVELYVQNPHEEHHSQGIYSLLKNNWVSVPKRRKPEVDDVSVRSKAEDLAARIDDAVRSNDYNRIATLQKKIKAMRQAGLEQQGEYGSDNLAFKVLRNQGYIKKLIDARNAARDAELSLAEQNKVKPRVRYGFMEASTPDGVSPSTKMFLEDGNDHADIVHDFILDTADKLGIKRLPRIEIHHDPEWSQSNKSFGMYQPESHTLHVSLSNRHLLDILRTTAHELAHCAQHQKEALPDNAGDTGSKWENEAHAVAGIIMRDYADKHPEYFLRQEIDEGIMSKTGAAAALAAAMALTPAQAQEYLPLDQQQQVQVQQQLNPVQVLNIARTLYRLKHNVTRAGAEEEINQEFKNYLRAQQGDPGSQNQSYLWQMQQRQQRAQQPQQPWTGNQYQREGIDESSGYIPTAKQKNDPRFKTALTVDIHPGQTGKEANKMSLKTDAQGKPGLLIKSANLLESALAEEFKKFKEQDLFEIRMSTSSLRQEAAKTGAQAGMEFEMIVPDVAGVDVEPEYERDEDMDRRARSFDDIEEFFYDGDYNSRGDVRSLLNELSEAYQEWKMDRTADDWDSEGVDYLRDYIENYDLFDRDSALDTARDEFADANPDIPLDSEEAQQGISARINELQEQFVLDEYEAQGRIYNDAFTEFADEKNADYDESDFLEETFPYMSDIQSNFDIQWPYYYDLNAGQSGDANVDEVADEFSDAIGRPVNASSSYHGARREPGHYVVEPDGSLEGDDVSDTGLEFVSPPLPIDELLSDLNKVKEWAGRRGCYTNDSTGLHINISVPNYSLDKLDYVKLALLMGDEYVLDLFGRSGNHYAKAATGKIRDALKKNPDLAPVLMDKMRDHMEDLATKAIHSGRTDKYTSINTKEGYIEFRSPGGDWLDANFNKIENTLLRFTVALSAAINPQAYRQEYLKKLYKLLEGSQDKGGVDVLQLFSNYSAGELDKAALIRQVREKQLARNLAKGKIPPGQKYWWEVTNPANNFASIEVVADSKENAIAVAVEPGNYPEWARVQNTLQAKPLRPYQEPEQKPGQTGNWGIWIINADRFANQPGEYRRGTEVPLYRFPTRAAAEQWIEQQRAARPTMRTDIEVREIEPSVQNTGSTTSGNWGVWVPSLDRWATIGNAGPRRFENRADAESWIQDYNQRHAGNDLELQAREIEPQQGSGAYTYRVFTTDSNQTVGTFQSDGIQGSTNANIAFRNYLISIGRDSAAGFNYEQIGRERQQPEFVDTTTQSSRGDLTPRGPGPWEIYRLSSNTPVRELSSTSRPEAEAEARNALGLRGEAPELYGVRTRQQSDAAQGGTIDVAGEQPQQQTFTGEWDVVMGGEVVFRVRGENQGIANQAARQWILGRSREFLHDHQGQEVEVVPRYA